MNSIAYDNLYSPRNNEINEENLNFLNEEVSQYIENNDDYEIQPEKYSQKKPKFGIFINKYS